MKKQFIYFFLALIFMIGNAGVGHANYLMEDDGGVIAVVASKQNNSGVTFSIPDQYLDVNGNLNTTIQITVTTKGSNEIFSVETKSLEVQLPNMKMSGKCSVTLTIGKYVETKSMVL